MRRGNGVYNKVMHAMDLLKEHGLVFGTSICYTSANYKSVTSEEFIQMLIDKGCRYALYFHYMPVGNAASVDLLLNPEQRVYVKNRVREIRNMEHGPGIFTMDFQNDGEFVGGCIAGGRNYFHINANGDAEPCVFIHYSNGNIHENTILEILKQPLFMLTMITSHSMTTCSVHARCWRTRRSCSVSSRNPAHIPQTSSPRKHRNISAVNAYIMQKNGLL
mgnify:CR=1 FL=1